MESIERLQRRIDTLGELHGVVRTMKALSAVSIRQYEHASQSLAEYYRTVELGMHVVLKEMEALPALTDDPGESRILAAIVFGSDHGLCGRFNEEIVTRALQRLKASAAGPENCLLVSVGSRVTARLEQAGHSVEQDYQLPGSADRITTTVQQILRKIDEWRSQDAIRYVYIFYNHHLGSGGYRPTEVQLLPVDLRHFQRLEEAPWPSRGLPTFSMNRKRLFAALLRQYLFVSIFRACAESQASEHASRLGAMQSAEKNIGEKLEEISTRYRRRRQEAITTELLDVVSGFEAVTAEDYR
ncbi:MAG: F0F1 ATP synthase subunit gamma [Gammaproteobacteria bacterium]|jgi:F-type H+-transporting ATPase subunit gamma